MIWLLTATAWAGPLDRPDPDEMSGYACLQGPAGAPTLGEGAVGSGPPGPPVLGDLASSLLPFATDEALKRAGKGKLEAWPAVATLATRGVSISANCQGPPTDRDDFSFGCARPLQCELLTSIDGKAQRLATRPQAGQRLAPVETVQEAVGLVALVEQDLFLPLTPRELERWAEEAAGYTAVEPALPWVEVEKHKEGWLVRAPVRARCGCARDVVRRAWWVAINGRSCPVAETPLILAQAAEPCEE